MQRRTDIVTMSLSVLAVMAGFSAHAQKYPDKPLKIIVPFGPGSTADILARNIGTLMGERLGQTVVIENKPGAGGTLGGAEAARAAPDGYTLVLGTVASHGVGTLLMPNVSYDPVKDFQPITMLADAPGLLVVNKSVPANNLAEFIEYARKHPGMSFSSAGNATTTHLAGLALAQKAGIQLQHVSYGAMGQALTDVVSGQVPAMMYQIPSLKPHIDSGALKAIGVTSAKRVGALPGVPAIAETYPGFEFTAWFGLMAPARTPMPIINRLNDVVQQAMKTPLIEKLFSLQGLEPSGMGPDEFKSLMTRDLPRWRDIIQTTGVK